VEANANEERPQGKGCCVEEETYWCISRRFCFGCIVFCCSQRGDECVDCHLPPKEKYFRHLLAKAYEGGRDIYKHHFGGEYETEALRKRVLARMPNERCLHCHDDLLGKPGSPGARTAHAEVLNPAPGAESKCVDCHENAGHERESKLFSE